MAQFELVIFDLDGTLIDSKLDLAHAVNAARAHMGLGPLEFELIYSYVGNGAPVLMRRAMGPEASEADVQRALDYFLDWYGDHKLDNTCLYPGVREALDRFRDAGVAMAVLTNKPVRISRAIVAGLGVGGHFFQVYGGNSFTDKKPHPAGVDKLMEERAMDRAHTLVVGDSGVDVRTARNAGVAVYGVTYGFAPESFEADPPDMRFESMPALADHVLRT
ncbi:MAG TPA: HAD-IA family hydrolase [Bryobacteraceae bacterium]|nr:HAD-IA family hydrolase [Bryobacteraceae bacterium]